MDFRPSGLSAKAKIITATFFFVILVVTLLIIVNNPDAPLFPKAVTCFVFILVILVLFLLAPSSYQLTESELIIKRRVGRRKVLLSSIREVRRVSKKDILRGVVRGGVGGIFGFFGKILSWEFGIYDAYFTNESKAVLIRADKPIVVSPDDPDLFVQKMSEMVKSEK